MELRHKQVSRQGSTVKRNKMEDYRIRVNAQWYFPSILSQPATISDLRANTRGYSSTVYLKHYCVAACTLAIHSSLHSQLSLHLFKFSPPFPKTDRKSHHGSQVWVCSHQVTSHSLEWSFFAGLRAEWVQSVPATDRVACFICNVDCDLPCQCTMNLKFFSLWHLLWFLLIPPSQVKENRMRRQKALELQRQEKSLKKSVLSEAKLQAQEEDRRKALKAKKEEEEIQREMVKLRKEMAEKRHTMAKAWRM